MTFPNQKSPSASPPANPPEVQYALANKDTSQWTEQDWRRNWGEFYNAPGAPKPIEWGGDAQAEWQAGRLRQAQAPAPSVPEYQPQQATFPKFTGGYGQMPSGPLTQANYYAPGGQGQQYGEPVTGQLPDKYASVATSQAGRQYYYDQLRARNEPLKAVQGQEIQFGLGPGDPKTTMRGKFAAFMGAQLPFGIGTVQQGVTAAMTAIPAGAIGFGVAGPVGALAAGVPAAWVGWQAGKGQYDANSTIGKMLGWLNVPFEIAEKTLGLGYQAFGASIPDTIKVTPGVGISLERQRNLGTLNDIFGSPEKLKAAYEAGGILYESLPIDIRFYSNPGVYLKAWANGEYATPIQDQTKMFVDYDLPTTNGGLSAIIEARKRIAAGEDAETVRAEIGSRFGAPGQIRDLAAGFTGLDPLDSAGKLVTAGLNVGGSLAGAEDVARAAHVAAEGPVSFTQAYRNILVTKSMPEFRMGMQAGENFNALQRLIVGKELLKLAETGTYTPPKWWELSRLTPQSEATESVIRFGDHLQTYLADSIPLDENYPRATAQFIDGIKTSNLDNLPAEMQDAAKLSLSVEGRVVQHALDATIAKDLANAWDASAESRTLLNRLQTATGASAEDLIKVINNGEGDSLLGKVSSTSSLTGSPTATDLAKQIADGTVNAKTLTEMAGMFGKDGVPYTLKMYRAALMSGLTEAAGKWAVETFGVTQPGFIQKLAGAVKGFESVALLGLNVTYPIKNFLNGEITMAARGVWGLRGIDGVMNDIERMGISPGRLAAGLGAADIGTDIGDLRTWGAKALSDGLNPIRDAATPEGMLADIQRKAGEITSKVLWPTIIAQKVEHLQSIRAFGEGMRQMWSQVWRRGVGFDKMPPALEGALAGIDKRLPGYIYAAVEAGMNPQEIAARILADAPRPMVQQFYGDVAARLGLPAEDVARLMSIEGVGDALNAGLANLPAKATANDVAKVFRSVREKALKAIDEMAAEDVAHQAEFAATTIETQGPEGLFTVMDSMETRLYRTFDEHMRSLDMEWDEVRRTRQYRDVVFANMRKRADATWNNYFEFEKANYQGMADGLKRAGLELDNGFMPAVETRRTNIADFHAQKNSLLDTFFKGKFANEAEQATAWAETTRQIDGLYSKLIEDLDGRQGKIDKYLLAVTNKSTSADYAEAVGKWREAVRQANREDMQAVLDFRRRVSRLLPDERNKEWRLFNDQRLQRRHELTVKAIETRRNAFAPPKSRPAEEIFRVAQPEQTVTPETPAQVEAPVSEAPVAEAPAPTSETEAPVVTPSPETEAPTPPAPTLPAADQLDSAALKEYGWKRGKRGLLNAVNKDRREAGLPVIKDLSEIGLDEARRSIDKRISSTPSTSSGNAPTPDDAMHHISASVDEAQAAQDLLIPPQPVDVPMTRRRLRDLLTTAAEKWGPLEVDNSLALMDARARAWAALNGRPVKDWWATHFKGVEKGIGSADLFQTSLDQLSLPLADTARIDALNIRMKRADVALRDWIAQNYPVHGNKVGPLIDAIRKGNYSELRNVVGFSDRGLALADEFQQANSELRFYQQTGHAFELGPEDATRRLNMDLLYQTAQPAPTFYSTLTRTIESKMGNRATPEQLSGMLKGAGVKPDELKWTGFDEWISKQTGPVSKDEALAFLRENNVKLQEVTKRQVPTPEEMARFRELQRTPREQMTPELWAENDRLAKLIGKGETKYGPGDPQDFTLPGGENYREVLMTMPNQGVLDIDIANRLSQEKYGKPYSQLDNAERDFIAWKTKGSPMFESKYKSPHWQEPNVLAHFRLDDRTTADGARMLFTEEIQSDWHQAGREKGYKTESPPPNLEDVEVKFVESIVPAGHDPKNYPGYWESFDKRSGRMISRHGFSDEAEAVKEAYRFLLLDYEDLKRKGIPPAPFAKTWHELAFRRILREGAEKGYEEIGWTTGAQQAERYSLAKQVDELRWTRSANGLYDVEGVKDGGSLFRQQLPDRELAANFGVDVAKQITGSDAPSGSLSGEGLSVGGEGMKGFYDKMMVDYANKYGKKWGAKVGESSIDVGRYSAVEAKQVPYNQTVHSFPITPEMRMSVLEGQPLFQADQLNYVRKGAVQFMDDGRAIIKAFEGADVSTLAHETGHIFRRDLTGADHRVAAEWAGATKNPASTGSADAYIWNVDAEEKFARGFEAYLMEGKAPTPALRVVFQKFKQWLTEIYRSIRGLNVEMSSEIRGVYDRLLGAEDLATAPMATQAVKMPRHTLPANFSAEMEIVARDMLDAAVSGQAGGKFFDRSGPGLEVSGYGSTYPDWYGQLVADGGKREQIIKALDKVITDAGADKGVMVERVKAAILEQMAQGVQGTPPEPEILKLLGRPQEEIAQAEQAWAALTPPADMPEAGPRPMLLDQFAGEPLFQSDPIPNGLKAGDAIDSQFGRVTIEGYDEAAKAWIVRASTVRQAHGSATGSVFLLPDATGKTTAFLTPEAAQASGIGPPMPHAQAFTESAHDKLLPLLDELQKRVEADVTQPQLKGAGTVDPETRAMMADYLRGVNGKMAQSKLLSMKWGEFKRDASLLNYSRRFQYNNLLGLVAPYEFWGTQSMMKWALHSIDRPQILSNYYRVHKFLNTQVQKPGFPSRLAGRVRIPLPFLPDWMGGGIWVDPLQGMMPLEGFSQPWEQYQNQQERMDGAATRQLQLQLDGQEITQQQFDQATTTKQGAAWDRAVSLAVADDKNLKWDWFDTASLLASPHLPIQWAYQAARGTPERISPLPMTKQVRALSSVLGIGGPSGVNLEEVIRRKFNLPVFDQWEDYRIDRMLANMAADGVATSQQATSAMIERSGPLFEQAQQRAAQESGYGTIAGMIFGSPAGIFPEGEHDQRVLGLLSRAAHQAQDNGDTEALNRFFDTYPEYEARLALYNKPEERIQNFLVDSVWTGWNALPALYRKEVQAALGPEFNDAFLSKETRNIKDIPPETLASWARTLGRYVPSNVEGKGYDIRFAPPEVARDYQQFVELRKQTWGEKLPMIYTLQSQYFAIPKDAETARPLPGWVGNYQKQLADKFRTIRGTLAEYDAMPTSKARTAYKKAHPEIGDYFDMRDWYGRQYDDFSKWIGKGDVLKDAPTDSQRSQFVAQYPILTEYWDWRRAWLDAHPYVQPYLDEVKAAGSTGSPTGSPAEDASGTVIADPVTLRLATAYLFDDRALPPTTRANLQAAYASTGSAAGQGFDEWLLYTLANGGSMTGAQTGPEFAAPGSYQPQGNAAPDPYATRPVTGTGGALQWQGMASQYGRQYGVPPEFILALIQTESAGNPNAVGDAGHSVGLFQLHDRGVGSGYSVAQRQDPALQFDLMMPRIASAYQSGTAKGLQGRELAMWIGQQAERPAAAAVPRYGVTYDQLMSGGR